MRNIFLFFLIFFSLLSFLIFSRLPALAEEQKDNVVTNHDKEEESYPGQVKVDQKGNKIKRWTTKGPVKVTDLNQQQGNSSLPAGTFINVNPNQLNRSSQHEKVIKNAD